MSFTSEIRDEVRGYADTALAQGRAVFEQGMAAAGTVVGTAVGTAGEVREDLRDRADKAGQTAAGVAQSVLPIDAVRGAVEPYVAQARQYRDAVTDRAEEIVGDVYSTVRSDKRVGRVIDTAETLGSAVVATISERVVEPIAAIVHRGPAKPTTAKSTPTRTTARKSSSGPARKTTAKKAPATKSAAKSAAKSARSTAKSAAKSTATSPAKKSTATTAKKASARQAPKAD